jgi:hypothetical protein
MDWADDCDGEDITSGDVAIQDEVADDALEGQESGCGSDGSQTDSDRDGDDGGMDTEDDDDTDDEGFAKY